MPLNTKTFCLNCHTRRAASEFALIDAVFGDLLNLRFVSQTIRTLRPFNYCDCQLVMLGGMFCTMHIYLAGFHFVFLGTAVIDVAMLSSPIPKQL